MTNDELTDFIGRYTAAWASREPGIMRNLWHADGVLHHPTIRTPVGRELVVANNDRTKEIPGFEWKLESWAANGDTVFVQWRTTGRFAGAALEFRGVDRFRVRDGRIAEEVVYFDT